MCLGGDDTCAYILFDLRQILVRAPGPGQGMYRFRAGAPPEQSSPTMWAKRCPLFLSSGPHNHLHTMSKPSFSLEPVNEGVYRVLDGQARHVGNLKRIGGQWKFKAVGYTDEGALIPGGGPLTAQHNQAFDAPDVAAVSARLTPSPGAGGSATIQG